MVHSTVQEIKTARLLFAFVGFYWGNHTEAIDYLSLLRAAPTPLRCNIRRNQRPTSFSVP
jgi:hypothetical protein